MGERIDLQTEFQRRAEEYNRKVTCPECHGEGQVAAGTLQPPPREPWHSRLRDWLTGLSAGWKWAIWFFGLIPVLLFTLPLVLYAFSWGITLMWRFMVDPNVVPASAWALWGSWVFVSIFFIRSVVDFFAAPYEDPF